MFLTQDLLHGAYKFMWDHVTKWLCHGIGEEELDCHFKAQPHLGFQNFTNGLSKISQVTGREHQTYLQFIIAVIAGHENVDQKVLVATQSLADYICMAHYPPISETDLEQMEALLDNFHKLKFIFIQNGSHESKNHLRIPKLHTLVHYIENSYLLGIPNNFSTKTPESLHIPMCKEPYRASNAILTAKF